MTGRLVAVDVETTGLDVDRHVVMEVAAVDVRSGEVFEFVPPLAAADLASADPTAFAVNRYFERRVFERASPANQWPGLASFLDGATICGANVRFDAAMLRKAFNDGYVPNGEPWHYRMLDLGSYAAGVLGGDPANLLGLSAVCDRLGVENTAPHSALGDALAAAECVRRLRALAPVDAEVVVE